MTSRLNKAFNGRFICDAVHIAGIPRIRLTLSCRPHH